MILSEPSVELHTQITRRYRFHRGTIPACPEASARIVADIGSMDVPGTFPQLYVHTIRSMERRPRIHTIGEHKFIVLDEAETETLRHLESTFINEDRPLVIWVSLARVLSELLYADVAPALGLYVADRVHAYAANYADKDGMFVRPFIVHLGHELSPDPDYGPKLTRLQGLLVVFHELGHALFKADAAWKDDW